MTTKVILILLATVPLLPAAEPTEEKTNMRAQLAGEIRQDAARLSAAPKRAAALSAAPEGGDDVVVLEPYKVTSPIDAFAHKIDEEEQRIQAEKFTLVNGGTFFKRGDVEVRLKYVPAHKGWDIFSLSW